MRSALNLDVAQMLEAAELLHSSKITGAPVASAGKLVGVLTQFE